MAIDTMQGTAVPVKLWTKLSDVEESAQKQLMNVAALPWAFSHVAVMPDVHAGVGATIGTVIAMKEAVAPSAVGVDIGCGVDAVRTNLFARHLPDNLADIRHQIERDVPTGFNSHDVSAFDNTRLPVNIRETARGLMGEFPGLTSQVASLADKAWTQIGTLGGGNHFIELCVDQDQQVWLILHSGSRYVGNKVAEAHIDVAMALPHNKELPDINLATLIGGTPQMESYWHDLMWAQRYARLNRDAMVALVFDGLQRKFKGLEFVEHISCHHNYAAAEMHFGEQVIVTRKGAIRAREGELGVIPGAMGGKTFIVKGKGNAEAFSSASHGAGRKMSRGQARRTFTEDDLKAQTKGVECDKTSAVLDEIPSAYKDIDVVIAYQTDLVEPVATLQALLTVKGGEEKKYKGDKRNKPQRGGVRE